MQVMLAKYFVFSITLILFGSLFLPTPILLWVPHLDNTPAYAYTLLCTVAFLATYTVLPFQTSSPENGASPFRPALSAPPSFNMSNRNLILLAILGVSGCVVLLLQIEATYGIQRYFAVILLTADSNTLRWQTVTVSSADGGYPGYVKMFNWNSVTAVFCLLAMLARGYRLKGVLQYGLAAVVGAMFAFAAFLRQDRLSSLALVPIMVSLLVALLQQRGKQWRKFAAIGGVALIFTVIAAQSVRRGADLGLLGWVALYVQVGTENLSLMMTSANVQHTYGFSTVLTWVTWIFKSFGTDIATHSVTLRWVWGDVDNGFGYWFLDFGWLGALGFLVLGVLARLLDNRCRTHSLGNANLPWKELQWIFAYWILSLPFVPASIGIEFWLMILCVIFLMRYMLGAESKARSLSIGSLSNAM